MKTIRTKWSLLTIALMSLTLVLFSSCNEDETPTPDPNVVEVAAANPNFSTLVTAVQTAGLVPTLSEPGPYTVFAPTNDAFTKFLTANKLTSAQLLASSGLGKTLTYHVVKASVPKSAVTAGKVTSVSGDPFYISISPTNEIWINGNTKITATDVAASNGIIHVLDNVITPPTQDIAQIAIASTTAAQPEFTQLVLALTRADLVGAVQGGFDKNITVFAPTDAAFRNLYAALGVTSVNQIDLDLLKNVLRYHVVPARAFSQDLRQGASLPTLLQGKNLTVNLSTLKINDAGLVASALNIHATNGVIHVIDKVMVPQ